MELPYGTFRVKYDPSPASSNDGHGAISRSAAHSLVATSLCRTLSPRKALAQAKRLLKSATHLQVFFVGNHGSSKGLHVIREDEAFARQFGSDVQMVSDSENLKSEMSLTPGHFAGKVNIWGPRGSRSAVLTASEDLRRRINTDVLGWTQTAANQTAAFQKLLAETQERVANGQPFTHEDAMLASWTQDAYGEQRLYSSDDERQIASDFPWTGSIHAKLFGGIGAYTASPGNRVPIQGTMCIIGGNGRYYGLPEPTQGYLALVTGEKGKPHTFYVNNKDYAQIMFILDTADNDGDLGVVVPARDPHTYLSEDPDTLWAMILRTPASPGGVAWLRLDNAAWNSLLEAGAMPITLNGPVPYQEFMLPDKDGNEPVHTLRPIGDSRPASAWDTSITEQIEESIHIRNQAALIGVFYRVLSAGHNADILDSDVPDWMEDLYRTHGMPPSTTGGVSTVFSDYVDSIGKQLNSPIEAMAEILVTAVTDRGVRLDVCNKQALWQPMFTALQRTTGADNRTIAATLNRAFSQNCMGDHWRSVQSITNSSAWFNAEFSKLQLMANGPATLLLADPSTFPGELIARINEVQTRISHLWSAKFAGDREIDSLVKAEQGDNPDDQASDDERPDSDFESWEALTQQQAEQQKAAAYRHTANRVARAIQEDLVSAAEAGTDPVTYFSAWTRLTALATNRFGRPKNGYRQAPTPLNTTSLFRALAHLERDQPELAARIKNEFPITWPGHGPTAMVMVEEPETLQKGERYEIRRNANNGQYLVCHNGDTPVTRVTAGAAHFVNLPLTFAGSPEPLDPTGESKEEPSLQLFLISSVVPQTVSVPTNHTEHELQNNEEINITRETTTNGPAYFLETTHSHLVTQMGKGLQASHNRIALDGVHEIHMGRKFRYAGTSSTGAILLRSEFKKTSKNDKLVDSIIELLLTS